MSRERGVGIDLGTPRVARIVVVVRVTALVLGALVLGMTSIRGPDAIGLTTLLVVLVGWSFAFQGTWAWQRQPVERTGALVAGLGIAWLGGEVLRLADQPLPFTLGVWLSDAWNTGFVAFLLVFPAGHLRGRVDRGIVALFAFVTIVLQAVWLLVWVPPDGPGNAFLVRADEALASSIDTVQRTLIILGAVAAVIVLSSRFARATVVGRRGLLPILAGAVAMVIGASLSVLFKLGIPIQPLVWMVLVAYIAVPIASLSSVVRGRLARAAVADLVIRLGSTTPTGELRDALARALGDPSLRLVRWSATSGGWVDTAGHVDGATVFPAGTVTVTRLPSADGGEMALLHDPALLDDPGLLASVAETMRLAADNERLQSEVHRQLLEVRESRARIVEAGDAERRRLERDLHDGAQQRLVSMMLALRVLQRRLADDHDPAIRTGIEGAIEEARAALGELRELAQGIHPQVLTEAGLGAAVEALAERCPILVSVEADRRDRFPAAIESAAYFLVSEGLTNVVKYAGTPRAWVRIAWSAGHLEVRVDDDGVGGADPDAGSGLRGLIDRLATVDGTLTVASAPTGGTHLLADSCTRSESGPALMRCRVGRPIVGACRPSSSSRTRRMSGPDFGCCWSSTASRSSARPPTGRKRCRGSRRSGPTRPSSTSGSPAPTGSRWSRCSAPWAIRRPWCSRPAGTPPHSRHVLPGVARVASSRSTSCRRSRCGPWW